MSERPARVSSRGANVRPCDEVRATRRKLSTHLVIASLALLATERPAAATLEPAGPVRADTLERLLHAQRRSCRAVSSCREAVEMWCGGYSGADRDKDGIPCENVCRSKEEVDEIRAEIGC